MRFISCFCSCFFGESDIWFTIWVSLKKEIGCVVHHVLNDNADRKAEDELSKRQQHMNEEKARKEKRQQLEQADVARRASTSIPAPGSRPSLIPDSNEPPAGKGKGVNS